MSQSDHDQSSKLGLALSVACAAGAVALGLFFSDFADDVMSMAGKFDQRTKLAVGLAVAGVAGAAAFFAFKCLTSSKKSDYYPKKTGLLPQTDDAVLETKVEKQSLESLPPSEEVQEVPAVKDEVKVLEQVPKKDEMPTEEHHFAEEASEVVEEAPIVSEKAPEPTEALPEEVPALPVAPPPVDDIASLETTEDGDVVVVEKKTEETESEGKSRTHSGEDSSISFDGSIITDEAIEELKQEQEQECGEPVCCEEDDIITEESMADLQIDPPCADIDIPCTVIEETQEIVESVTPESASNVEAVPEIHVEAEADQDDIPETTEEIQEQEVEVEIEEDKENSAPWMKNFDGTAVNSQPEDDSQEEPTLSADDHMKQVLADIRKMKEEQAQELKELNEEPVENGVDSGEEPKQSGNVTESDSDEEDEVEENSSNVWVQSPAMDESMVCFGMKIETSVRDDVTCHRILDVEEGSPAAQIGLREGDEIVRLNSMPVTQWKHDILLEQLKLVATEGIDMTLRRKDEDDAIVLTEVKAALKITDDGISVTHESSDLTESQLCCDRDLLVSAYNGMGKRRTCRIRLAGTDVFLLAKGHKLEAGKIEEDHHSIFRREMFNCVDKCPESPYFDKQIYVFVFRAGHRGIEQSFISALSGHTVGLQRKERILRRRLHSLSRADSRYFIHHFAASGFDCFESTQLPGHYLASDKEGVYLKYVSSDKERDDNKDLHFIINYM